LLFAFEHLSGLKINFHKSEVFCYGAAKEVEVSYLDIFGVMQENTRFVIWGF
jgi:hypothetical protein